VKKGKEEGRERQREREGKIDIDVLGIDRGFDFSNFAAYSPHLRVDHY
jgi:hypothetical protein